MATKTYLRVIEREGDLEISREVDLWNGCLLVMLSNYSKNPVEAAEAAIKAALHLSPDGDLEGLLEAVGSEEPTAEEVCAGVTSKIGTYLFLIVPQDEGDDLIRGCKVYLVV